MQNLTYQTQNNSEPNQLNMAKFGTQLNALNLETENYALEVQFKNQKQKHWSEPNIIFGDFNEQEQDDATKHYEEITSIGLTQDDTTYFKIENIISITIISRPA